MRSQSRQAARVWQQNRMVCALRPSLVSMVTGCRAGRARARPGCSRRPCSLADPGNARSRAVSVPPVSVPTRSVTSWPNQGGERGPGHGRARQAQPRGQDGAGHGEMVQRRQRLWFHRGRGRPGRVRAFQCHHRWRLTHRRERRRRHPGSPRRTAGTRRRAADRVSRGELPGHRVCGRSRQAWRWCRSKGLPSRHDLED